jgi:hypothetical protein
MGSRKGGVWMEGSANLVHQLARARDEERVARSLKVLAPRGVPDFGMSRRWTDRVVAFARRRGILAPVAAVNVGRLR